ITRADFQHLSVRLVSHEIDGIASHFAVAHIHVFGGFDSSFAFRFSKLRCDCLEIGRFAHDVQRLSTLYLPGPTKARPVKTTPISMACEAPMRPSPRSRCESAAISIVNASEMATGRKNNPSRKHAPPAVSASAAKKPHIIGIKVTPIFPMALPTPSHRSGPPSSFG